MGQKTEIAWCDSTWNPVRGCTRVSSGCKFCYAERMAARFSRLPAEYEGTFRCPGPFHGFAEQTKSGPRWTGRVELIESQLEIPLHWRKPRRIFVNSMSDTFHEALPDADRTWMFWMMELKANWHTYIVLTKRAKEMEYFMRGREIFPNVWLGVSVEDQATADERIPLLLQTPAAVRFISLEPMLSRVDFAEIPVGMDGPLRKVSPHLDLVLIGGESGPGARPCRVEWIESVIEQCAAAGVACFTKQLGAYPVWAGAKSSPIESGLGKNADMERWPKSLRVREFPHVS